ncbi:MAG: hypothetical protein K2G52_04620 [Muribaculaceae bacterium]|nr:hypothetical protein [Muribaculaceae bacterium]
MNNQNNAGVSGNFLQNVRLELIQNRKQVLLCVLCVCALYILCGIYMGYNHCGGGKGETLIFALMAQLIALVFASLSFNDMKRKEMRIYSLMIPASTGAKFLTRWIAAVPALFILLVIGFYLGDLARIATFAVSDSSAAGFPEYMKVFNPWRVFYLDGDRDGLMFCCLVFSAYFFQQALYFLGAILWPKLSFVKTFAVIYVIQTVLGICLMIVHRLNVFSLTFIDDYIRTLLWSIFGILVVLTLGCYWLAYARYVRSQVVYKLF